MTRAMVEGVGQQLALVRDSVVAPGARVTTVRAPAGAARAAVGTGAGGGLGGHAVRSRRRQRGSGSGAALLAWHASGELASLAAGSWAGPAASSVRIRGGGADGGHGHLTEQLYRALGELPWP